MLKKILSVILSFSLIFVNLIFAQNAEALSVSAQSAILICPDNGNVIFEKNCDEKLSMASTTKIMTAILGLETAAANDAIVEFTNEMISEGSSIYLKVGDRLKLSELIKGLLAASGNDAANAIAIQCAGSIEKFVKKMNDRAAQLNMTSTSFATPSGLDDDMHYSTARDMAILMSYAMESPEFAKIVSQKSVQVCFKSPENQINTYQNHNRLLSSYKYCIGGKTGFTKKSGRCLVSCAEKDGIRLIAVTLNAPDDWNDHTNMYEYGFSTLIKKEIDDTNINLNLDVVGGEYSSLCVNAKQKASFTVNKDLKDKIEKTIFLPSFVYSPVRAGEEVGRIEYYTNGELIASVPLIATKEIKYTYKEKNLKTLWDKILSWLNVFDL